MNCYSLSTWVEFPSCIGVTLPDKTELKIKIGDVIWYKGREDTGVLITDILGNEDGPRGFTYLPWRDTEKRWATLQMSVRGNPRFVVCYPTGDKHCGMHIDWSSVRVVQHPDADHPAFKEVVEQVVTKKQTGF
jgi:hypothetical protein